MRRFMSTAGCRSPASAHGTSTLQSGSILARSSLVFSSHTRIHPPPGRPPGPPGMRPAQHRARLACFCSFYLRTRGHPSLWLSQSAIPPWPASTMYSMYRAFKGARTRPGGQFRSEDRGPRSRSIPRFTRRALDLLVVTAGCFEPLAVANPAADRRDVGGLPPHRSSNSWGGLDDVPALGLTGTFR